MLLITTELARRLETAEAIDAAGCAESHCRIYAGSAAAAKSIAGGVAVYCGADSPLTHSVGIGMHGPVSHDDIDELEAFFNDKDAPVIIDLCPHADPTLRELLTSRNYKILEFIDTMVRSLSPDEPLAPASADIQVRTVGADEQDLYITTVIGGFFGRDSLNEQEQDLGCTLFHMPCSSSYLAFIEGFAVGGGAMSIRNQVASFFSDATHPRYRCHGVQSAVIRSRLIAAQQAGCNLIAAGTVPGSDSQRNYQRLGFQVAYTKVTMGLE